jgi:uncharacterized membrane protein YtjA (UPF0391 family)
MLRWSISFFVLALVAAAFGFGGISADASEIAKLLFIVFLVFSVLSYLLGRRAPTP